VVLREGVMQIAPGIDSSEWAGLQLDDPLSKDWEKAISAFKSRIYSRFIEPADVLVSIDENKPATARRFGFAILAIDCLVVETLGAFQEGLKNTDGKSKATFAKFLSTSPGFRQHFTRRRAEDFYREFRCGILHQAEIAGKGKVWSVGELVHEFSGRLTVNRTKFHQQLKSDMETYIATLRDAKNTKLRSNFRKKMNFICHNSV
jgi:hypothetical protein